MNESLFLFQYHGLVSKSTKPYNIIVVCQELSLKISATLIHQIQYQSVSISGIGIILMLPLVSSSTTE